MGAWCYNPPAPVPDTDADFTWEVTVGKAVRWWINGHEVSYVEYYERKQACLIRRAEELEMQAQELRQSVARLKGE